MPPAAWFPRIPWSWPTPSASCSAIRRSARAWVRPAEREPRRALGWSVSLRRCAPSIARLAGLLEQREVVLLYGPPWDGPTRFSKHHLASYFAERGRRVLYVEAPLTIFGLRRGAQELRRTLQPPHRVGERLWVRRYFLPVPYHAASPITAHRLANRVGQRLLMPALRRDLSRLSFKMPLVIAGLPHALDILPGLPRSCLVYHCADDYASVRGFPASLPQLEAELCQRADLVITTWQTLCEDRRRFNRRTYWIPNGADVAHFSQPASPAAELSRLARPLVGFVG